MTGNGNWIVNGRIRHIEVAILSALLCWAPDATPALAQQSATEDQVKAAFLFNFAKFIEWPAEVFERADSSMIFCTEGNSPVVDELDSSIQGKTVNGHIIAVRHLREPEEIKGCHLVFVAASAGKPQQQRLLQAAKGLPILLVAEISGFARAGGAINFLLENGRVMFEVNIRAAESAHLKISSKLLALARIVATSVEGQALR